jgi:hypothetical protein
LVDVASLLDRPLRTVPRGKSAPVEIHDAKPERIPPSGEERIALATLRLLGRAGVIGPSDPR